jgi:hypothetical protein
MKDFILYKAELLELSIWIVSLFLMNKVFAKKLICWIYYFLISGFFILLCTGKKVICQDYFSNIVTEVIGIIITVLIIDRVYKHISKQEETVYRNCAIKYCRTPLFWNCKLWFSVFQPNNSMLILKLKDYNTIKDFFLSDEFYKTICSKDFSKKLFGQTEAQRCASEVSTIENAFQDVLSKYASKLRVEDIQNLEYFAGAEINRNFRVMEFATRIILNNQSTSNLNQFRAMNKSDFQNYFTKLSEFIDEYNKVVSTSNDKINIQIFRQ